MKKLAIKNKRRFIVTLTAVFVLCLVVGITLAYLGSTTQEKTNVFTGAENIRAKLREPNWDAEKGLELVPGTSVKKDPMIENTGDTEEYVAIRLTFQKKDGTPLSDAEMLRLLNLTQIDWNYSKWRLCDGVLDLSTIYVNGKVKDATSRLIFYYDTALSKGKITDPVFSNIKVRDNYGGLTEADLRWLQGVKIENGEIVTDPDGIGNFKIVVEGAAVQTSGFEDAADAAETLKSLFP